MPVTKPAPILFLLCFVLFWHYHFHFKILRIFLFSQTMIESSNSIVQIRQIYINFSLMDMMLVVNMLYWWLALKSFFSPPPNHPGTLQTTVVLLSLTQIKLHLLCLGQSHLGASVWFSAGLERKLFVSEDFPQRFQLFLFEG